MTTGGRLYLDVQYGLEAAGLVRPYSIRRWLKAACAGNAYITVRFVDAEEGRALNRDFRGRDYATNVLSFPYQEADPLEGDLVVCWPVVEREAAEQGKSLRDHLAHLIIHGALHLQGLDHETDEEAERMEAREAEILAKFGVKDPYGTEKDPA